MIVIRLVTPTAATALRSYQTRSRTYGAGSPYGHGLRIEGR